MNKFRVFTVLALLSFSGMAHSEWNGVGVIEVMYIYPNYAVVVQGRSSPGQAGCQDGKVWSFYWSKFDAATQARIQSMLLTAYTAQLPIQVVVSDSTCGPEGKKDFTGQIQFP